MNPQYVREFLKVEKVINKRLKNLETEILYFAERKMRRLEFEQSELDEIWNYEDENMALIDNYIEELKQLLGKKRRELCKK